MDVPRPVTSEVTLPREGRPRDDERPLTSPDLPQGQVGDPRLAEAVEVVEVVVPPVPEVAGRGADVPVVELAEGEVPGHVGGVVEEAVGAGGGAAVPLAGPEVGGLVHVDPGAVNGDLG